MTRTARHTALAAGLMLTCCGLVAATDLTPDPAGAVATLPAPASPHWVWVNDIVFPHMSDGQARLVDGDTGRFLGLLSTGMAFEHVVLARDGKLIFSPETYFSRGTRGTRTDVVTLYDAAHLSPRGEIAIPAKRAVTMPMMADAGLTDDGAFLLIYNYTPAQSVTVVDTRSRRFAGEIETPGCALVYPTGPRSFFSICADGALLDVHLDDGGHVSSRVHTRDFFDVSTDPVTEKGVRLGSRWLFVSYGGTVYSVDITTRGLEAGPRWSLLSDAERRQHWRPGGLQQLAVHAGPDRLYSIMHQGGPETHKDPGKEIWVYDLDGYRRVRRIALRSPAGSIQVTRDDRPLLFAAFIGSTTLEVYDAETGRYLRSVADAGTTPTLLVTP
ncbi:MAG TPA: amine dehydrogenase large subunit [Steroidobacteraceae bacterium]|nr:amine dehydrogenase large subunit [Steroidobacteraceae bacterium]